MKTSLTKVLARMARDGNAEAVAEFIEEMISHEPAGNPPEPTNAENAEEPETVPEPAPAEEPVTVEIPENRTVLIDSETAGAFLQRLDRLLDLLAACLAPAAADETPAESTVEETAEKAAEKVAEEIAETAAEATETAVAEAVEEILGEASNTEAEVSEILEESGDECAPQDPTEAKDALRAVLKAVRPALAEMSPARRRKLSADIAANLRAGKDASTPSVYSALLKNTAAPAADPADLGKRIMAKRNTNYH